MTILRFALGCVLISCVAEVGLGVPPVEVVYVDASAGVGDGSSWEAAYGDLQTAIDGTAVGGEVWVRAGTYGLVVLRDGVSVYGGFAGTETERAQADPVANVAVIGGDTAPIGHLVTAVGVGAGTVLDGFEISGGVAGDDAIGGVGGAGGGMLLDGSAMTVSRCVVEGNRARIGAGAMVIDGSPVFEGSSFLTNYTTDSGEGGGIYAMSSGGAGVLLTVSGCEVRGNAAYQRHFATGHGGGLYVGTGVDLVVRGSVFASNFVFHNQSYGDATSGGGISFRGGTATVEDSVFLTNYGAFGAGIYSSGVLSVVDSVFVGNRAVAVGCAGPECNGAPDVPSGVGGGVYATNGIMVGCTLAANWGAKGAGGVFVNGTVDNCVLWANEVYPVCCGEDPIDPVRRQIDGANDITYSCVESLFESLPGEDPPDPANFPGCIAVDPGFLETPVVSEGFGTLQVVGDVHLAVGSACIDAGSNGAVPVGDAADADGNARFVDDPGTVDSGEGTAPVVDMGAYEFAVAPPVCAGDIDGDGDTDVFDFGVFAVNFGTSGHVAFSDGDLDGDGDVDVFDFGMFALDFGCGG